PRFASCAVLLNPQAPNLFEGK
ncbi:MAG: hypothetical protein QOH98_181, partial [Methylobacteriaceae bacterium]|nr:hypothetical protein [Methylobacteriaceae bacterium]